MDAPAGAVIARPIGLVVDGELDGLFELLLVHWALKFTVMSSRGAQATRRSLIVMAVRGAREMLAKLYPKATRRTFHELYRDYHL